MGAVKAEQFRKNLLAAPDRWRAKCTAMVDGITFELYALIISAPEHRVDTGRMRGSWAVSVVVPGDFVLPPVKKGGHARKPRPKAFVAELRGAPLEAKRLIYNNVEYAVFVELGTGTREGQHVVTLAIQRLRAKAA